MTTELETLKERIDPNKNDFLVNAAKSLVGSLDFFPSWLQAMIDTAIDECYTDNELNRLRTFVKEFYGAFTELQDQVDGQTLALYQPMLADASHQAKRAATDERIEHLARLLASCISADDMELYRKEKLVEIFGQLNDAELILLRFYYLDYYVGPDESLNFAEQHENIIYVPSLAIARKAGEEEEQQAMEQRDWRLCYDNNLARFGLIRLKAETDKPRYSEVNPNHYQMTPFGKAFVMSLGFS